MRDHEYVEMGEAIELIVETARQMGLAFYPMRFEICPADILYSIGAYGMPTRFSHWSFGKAFQRMKMEYDFQLSKIYELVINSNPCYAFLLENNSLMQNKLITAHVLGHSDFFKNNAYFSLSNRDMVESMAVTARRMREFESIFGMERVESFLDAALSIQEHIDPQEVFRDGTPRGTRKGSKDVVSPVYKSTGGEEQKDVVRFIAENSRVLVDWQREVLFRLREEMLYFWPQMETKIMNEGWATFWHIRIIREMNLDEAEALEFARMNAQVIQPSRTGVNPYLLGLRMFEALEKQWGREAIFEIREMENDVSFIRNHLTKDIMKDLDLYLFGRIGNRYEITTKEWETVRDGLIRSRVNGGHPYIVVKDGDYKGNGELYLLHKYEGVELDPKYISKTIPYLFLLWGRGVHLETVESEKTVRYTWNGELHKAVISA